MTGFWENVQNTNFWHLIPLIPQNKICFQNSCRITFLLYGTLTSCKVSEKANERSLRYQRQGRTDRQTDEQGLLLWTPSGKPRVQNEKKQLTKMTQKCIRSETSCSQLLKFAPEKLNIILNDQYLLMLIYRGGWQQTKVPFVPEDNCL